jgi:hypothetical protein
MDVIFRIIIDESFSISSDERNGNAVPVDSFTGVLRADIAHKPVVVISDTSLQNIQCIPLARSLYNDLAAEIGCNLGRTIPGLIVNHTYRIVHHPVKAIFYRLEGKGKEKGIIPCCHADEKLNHWLPP